ERRQLLLLADARAIGRVDHDQAGLSLRRSQIGDRLLLELRYLRDARAGGVGLAHADGAGVVVAAVEPNSRRCAAARPAQALPRGGVEAGELLEGEMTGAAGLEAGGDLGGL